MDEGHPAIDQFRKWLVAGLSGCSFAARLARRADRLSFYRLVGEPFEGLDAELDQFFERAADDGTIPVTLFPSIRSAASVVQLVKLLRSGARWSAREVLWQRHSRESDACLVGLEWSTRAGLRSQVMGFAPLGSMSVSRRAPYVAVAAWPGGHDNPYFDRGPADVVGFADAAPHLDTREAHDKLWRNSEEATRRLTRDPPEDVVTLRRVAFCLPRAELEAGDPAFFGG